MKRIDYLDSLKGGAILLVVFCHFTFLSPETFSGNVVMQMAWSGVPIFFMVSGGLQIAVKPFVFTKYRKSIGSLYLKVCGWKLIYFLVYRYIMHMASRISIMSLIRYLLCFGNLEDVDTGVMWYMNAYIMIMLIFPAFYVLYHEHYKVYISITILCLLSGIVLPSADWVVSMISQTDFYFFRSLSDILPFSNHSSALFYFLIGGVVMGHLEEIRKCRNLNIISSVMVAIGLVGTIIMKWLQTGSIQWKCVYFDGGYLHFSVMVMSIGLYLFFAYNEGKIGFKFLSFIGKYTMGIYFLHYLLLAVICTLIIPYLQFRYCFTANVIKTIVVTVVCIATTAIARKIPLLQKLFV